MTGHIHAQFHLACIWKWIGATEVSKNLSSGPLDETADYQDDVICKLNVLFFRLNWKSCNKKINLPAGCIRGEKRSNGQEVFFQWSQAMALIFSGCFFFFFTLFHTEICLLSRWKPSADVSLPRLPLCREFRRHLPQTRRADRTCSDIPFLRGPCY